jgi:hypothetical protein
MKAREPELARRIGHRDAALMRLRRTTVFALAGTGALAVACGGLAAKAFPGKSRHHVAAPAVVQTTVARTRTANPAATPPPLVSAGASAPSASSAPSTPSAPSAPSTPPPSPPPAAPVATPAPPVAVSGGS